MVTNATPSAVVQTFTVHCPRAEHMYLLLRLYDRVSQVLPMQSMRGEKEVWQLRVTVPAGEHPHRFYAYEEDHLRLCTPRDCASPDAGGAAAPKAPATRSTDASRRGGSCFVVPQSRPRPGTGWDASRGGAERGE